MHKPTTSSHLKDNTYDYKSDKVLVLTLENKCLSFAILILILKYTADKWYQLFFRKGENSRSFYAQTANINSKNCAHKYWAIQCYVLTHQYV